MNELAIRLLRVVLVVLLLAAVLTQVLVPLVATETGSSFPEVAYLVVPYSAAAILFIGCGQVGLLAVWRLLSMVSGGVVFTRQAVRWVDIIRASAAVATLLTTGVLIHMLGFVPGSGGPMVYYLAGCLFGSLALVLLMTVMKGLLESAIANRTELDGVI